MKEVKLRVGKQRLSDVPISRFILGNFIESGFGRQVSGMWAEMLFNRSFIDAPPYNGGWVRLRREYYNENAPFWHSGYEEFDWELIDEHSARSRTRGFDSFKGMDSLLVSYDGKGKTGGIRQRGLFVKASVLYDLSFFGGFSGARISPSIKGFAQVDKAALESKEVKVVLREEKNPDSILFSRTFAFTCLQQQFGAEISLPQYTGRAVLEISFEWQGGIMLSWASLMPRNNVRGWKKEVVELLKEAAVPIIRFPGGCFTSFFDWRRSVGPRSGRGAMEDYNWRVLEENDVGIDEFLDLCHEIECEPQICINMMTSTPFKAAELVEYCNGPEDSCMGRFRRENGAVRKNRVTYWEMENEPFRKWSAVQYAEKVVEFAAAMRSVDPSIQIMMAYYAGYELEWLPQMLEIAGHNINYVIHRSSDRPFIAKALSVLREYNAEHGTSIRQVNTEWIGELNAPEPFPDSDIPHEWVWGMDTSGADYKKLLSFRQIHWFYALNVAGRVLDHLSYGGEFFSANFNNCVNTWGQNIIESAKEGAWFSPPGRVFRFFVGIEENKYPLQTDLEEQEGVFATAQACETADGKGINLYVVNYGREELKLSLSMFGEYTVDSAEVLSAPDRLSRCTLHRDEVALKRSAVNSRIAPLIEPLSVTTLYLRA